MHFDRLELQNFGKLQGVFEFEARCCNVVCAGNEFGKSTMVDALLYALYPMPSGAGRSAGLKPRDRYTPWQAQDRAPQLRLILTRPDGTRHAIEVDFTKKSSHRLVDLATNHTLPLPNNSYGESKLGLSFGACLRSFILRQEELRPPGEDANAAIQSVIERAVGSAASRNGVSVRNALELLSKVRVSYGDSELLPKTARGRIEDDLRRLRRERDELEAKRQQLGGEAAQLEELARQLAEAQQRERALRYGLLRARLRELEREMAEQERRKAEHASKCLERQRLEPYATYSAEQFATLQRLYGELVQLRQRVTNDRMRLAQDFHEPLAILNRELAGVASSAEQLTQQDADRLDRLVHTLEALSSEIAILEQRACEIESQLRRAQIDPSEFFEVCNRIEHLDPKDFGLLLGQYREQKQALEAQLAQTSERLDQARQTCADIQGRLRRLRNAVAVGTLLAMASAAGFVAGLLLKWPVATTAGLVSTVVAGATTVILWVRSTKLREDQLFPAQSEVATSESLIRTYRDQLDQLENQFAAVRRRAGVSTAELLDLEIYSQHLKSHATAFLSVRRDLAARKSAYEQNLSDAVAIARLIEPSLSDRPDLETLERCRRAIVHYFDRRERRRRLSEQLEEQETALEQAISRAQELENQILRLLDQAQTPPGDMAERIDTYKRHLHHAERFRELVKELASLRIWTAEEEAQKRAQQQQWEEEVHKLEREDPGLSGSGVPNRPSSVWEAELDRAREQVNRCREAHEQLARRCAAAMDQYRSRMPELMTEIESMEALLASVQRVERALDLVREVLSRLNEDVARDWQRELKERLELILPRLLPHYEQPGVGTNLELTLRDATSGRVLEGHKELAYLSKGTRDQLEFALRVAIGDVLTAHCGPLPLVLDEPFAHWDDERFMEGIRFLTELAAQRQILLLTCHRWRFDRLQQEDPGLWARLHFVVVD